MIARHIIALASGLLFGLGLSVSGMIDPARVLGFLDVLGDWDPTLMGVMAGAVPTAALIFALVKKRERSLLDAPMPLPPSRLVDRKLIIGAALFGIGWGLAGFCPAPAIATLAVDARALWFVAAMAVGMTLYKRFVAR